MEISVECPYCGEPLELYVDPSGGSTQKYVEDCAVCCQPMEVMVEGKKVMHEVDEGLRPNASLQAISDTLNAEGVPTLRGGTRWRPKSSIPRKAASRKNAISPS